VQRRESLGGGYQLLIDAVLDIVGQRRVGSAGQLSQDWHHH
jgi:hypothetical protein